MSRTISVQVAKLHHLSLLYLLLPFRLLCTFAIQSGQFLLEIHLHPWSFAQQSLPSAAIPECCHVCQFNCLTCLRIPEMTSHFNLQFQSQISRVSWYSSRSAENSSPKETQVFRVLQGSVLSHHFPDGSIIPSRALQFLSMILDAQCKILQLMLLVPVVQISKPLMRLNPSLIAHSFSKVFLTGPPPHHR